MEISGIVIEIQGKKYAIEMDDARTLYNELHNLFGSTPVYIPWIAPYSEPYRVEPYNPRPWWEYQPVTTTPLYGAYTDSDSGDWLSVTGFNTTEIENG